MYLIPQTFDFQLATRHGRPLGTKQAQFFDTSKLPDIHAYDTEVLEELKGNFILKVSFNGRLSCCKVVDQYLHQKIRPQGARFAAVIIERYSYVYPRVKAG